HDADVAAGRTAGAAEPSPDASGATPPAPAQPVGSYGLREVSFSLIQAAHHQQDFANIVVHDRDAAGVAHALVSPQCKLVVVERAVKHAEILVRNAEVAIGQSLTGYDA